MLDSQKSQAYTKSTKGDNNATHRQLYTSTFPTIELKETHTTPVSQKKARNVRDVAGILSPLSDAAQEELYTLTTDQSGDILKLHKFCKGEIDQAPAPINSLAGHVLSLENAHTTYIVHNHPSGDLAPSDPDRNLFNILKRTLKLVDVETRGLVIANRQFIEYDETETSEPQLIPGGQKNKSLPVFERRITGRRPMKSSSKIGDQGVLNKLKFRSDGIYLSDSYYRELRFFPYEKGRALKDVTLDILKEAETLNATTAFINHQVEQDTNREKLYEPLMSALGAQGITVVDVLKKKENGQLYRLRDFFATLKEDFPNRPEAISDLNSEEVLYATSSDFPSNNYDVLPGEGLSLKDIQERFKGQAIFKGQDGSLSIHFKNGRGAKIHFIEHISPEESNMMIASGRMKKNGNFLGKCSHNKIYLHDQLANTWIRDHEFSHLLKNLGMVTDEDLFVLDNQIDQWIKSDSLKFKLGAPADNRAHAMAQLLEDRKVQRETKTGAILQKASDLIDGLRHITRKSARKLAREIETGEIFNRSPKDADIAENTSPAVTAINRDIECHKFETVEMENRLQKQYVALVTERSITETIEQTLEDLDIAHAERSCSPS